LGYNRGEQGREDTPRGRRGAPMGPIREGRG